MRPTPYVLVAGFSALAVAIVGARLLAPFYGLGPFLVALLLTVAFLAVALGVHLGGRAENASPRGLGLALLFAGLWTLLALWARRPLFSMLEPLGLRADVTIAAVLLIGPTLVLLGSVVSRALLPALAGSSEPGKTAAGVLGAFLFGVALAAPLVPFVILPRLGLSGTAILIGVIQIVCGALATRTRDERPAVMVGAVALLAAAAVWSAPAAARVRLPAQVMAIDYTMGKELRVVERDGSRYLLEDGTIHGVVEPMTWAGLRRPEAALELANLLNPEPGGMLILGLRGGSLAKRFTRRGWTVDVVEPDSGQARMARRWLGLLPGEARLVLEEPRAFLRRARESYDLIVLDAFADNFVEPELVTRECFALAKARLFQGGLVALVIESQGWQDPLIRSLAATLSTEFRAVVALPTGEPPDALGSVILLAAGRPLEIAEESLPQPFEELADPLEHWNAMQMSHAWVNRFEPDARGVPVLTDDRNPAELWGERINLAAREELHRFFGKGATGGRGADPSW